MTINYTINGVTYAFPTTGDEEWGDVVTSWANAVTLGMLQKAGGSFTLTSDVNFGANYGLLSQYYSSRSSNVADSGNIRLANSDSIRWRNSANNANLALNVSGDNLQFDGSDLVTGPITNDDVGASAAIDYSKLATLSVSRALTSDGSGFVSASSVTSTELGYVSGVTSAIQTQIDAKEDAVITTRGDLIVGNASGDPSRLGLGTNTQVLTSDGTDAYWATPSSGFANPMTTEGDLILATTSGVAARLPIGSANQILTSNGTTASWEDPASTLNYEISSSSGLYTASTTGPNAVTNLSVTITTNGGPVELKLVNGNIGVSKANSASAGAQITFLRDASVASNAFSISTTVESGSSSADPEIFIGSGNIVFIDEPAAGTYTYTVNITNNGTGSTYYVYNCQLVAKEWRN